MTPRDQWQAAQWLLRARLARLASLRPSGDLTPFKRVLASLRSLAADGAPAGVLELVDRLEFELRQRETVQGRASRVVAGGDSDE